MAWSLGPWLIQGCDSKYKNRVTVRPVLRCGLSHRSYIATFSASPPWCGKQIPADSGFRLITALGLGTCRFCRDRGHTMEDCPNLRGYSIGSVESSALNQGP